MAIAPPTERMIRAALALQVAALEWDQAMAPNAHQTNAPPVEETLNAMRTAADTLASTLMYMIRITRGAQG